MPSLWRHVARAMSVVTMGSSFWLSSNAAHASAVLPVARRLRPSSYRTCARASTGCALAGVAPTMRRCTMTTLREITSMFLFSGYRLDALDRYTELVELDPVLLAPGRHWGPGFQACGLSGAGLDGFGGRRRRLAMGVGPRTLFEPGGARSETPASPPDQVGHL